MLGSYIRSAKRPLTRWMSTYPLVAARCCLSIDQSSASTTARGTSSNISNSIQGTYNSNPRIYEATCLRRVFQRLHRKHIIWQKKMKYGNSESSTSIMSLDQQLLRIKQENIVTESNRMLIQSFLPQGTGIPFIDAVLCGESLVTTTSSKPAPLERTKEEYTTLYQTTPRLVLELVRMERFFAIYIVLPLLLLIITESSSFLF